MGFDAIGLHAIGELITAAPPSVTYETPSRPTGSTSSVYFRKDAIVQTSGPIVVTDDPVLWDDGSNILWDDDSAILWDE